MTGFEHCIRRGIRKGELTYKQAQARYGVQERSTVWGGYASTVASVGGVRNFLRPCPETQTAQTLEQQIKTLQVQLHEANGLFEAMLDKLGSFPG